ncbi:MAG TPA: ATP phosphoribosyltransferase, partial [Flexistipes sinusarabici]|nr:ATP phosphoribosyltransferase [Flexistipes sinusarabici]
MNDYLTIALPKGRLAEETVNLLDSHRIINKESINFKSRKLIFEDTKGKVRFLMIRNMDVPTYVEHGACDLGVVGKD